MEVLPEPEPIRAIQSLCRENKVQDALVLSKQRATVRSDFSGETQVQQLHLEAECHEDPGDHARAVASYDRILARCEHSVARANRGLARSSMGETEWAIDDADQAMGTGPAGLILLGGLREMHNGPEEHALALPPQRTADALNPGDARTLCAPGFRCHGLEDGSQADRALNRAVELDPKNRVARPGKSRIEREIGLSEDTRPVSSCFRGVSRS